MQQPAGPGQQQGSQRVVAKSHFLKSLDLNDVLCEEGDQGVCGIKVVATIGPSCHEVPALSEVLEAGAVGARFDLTWGSLDFHRQSIINLQAAMRQTRRLACTMIDTLGRELMIRRQVKMDENGWPMHEESVSMQAGQQVVITTRPDAVASDTVLPITYERFTEMVEAGDTIYVGRYLVCGADSASLYLEVTRVVDQDIMCVAKNDAVLDGLLTVFHVERSAAQSVAVANVQNALPLLSEYDKEAIKALSREFELDFISLSYTRCEEDIHEARAFLSSIGCTNTRVLAKVETRQALINFDGILSAADGIIISRGNLGLDNPPEKIAMIQKTLIQMCNLVGKPVLITRVVDTMVNSPRPTRAEATDVANATLDGVDGILLGAETLRGKDPSNCVRTICRICRSAEKVFDYENHYDSIMAAALLEEEARALELMQDGGASQPAMNHWASGAGVPVPNGRNRGPSATGDAPAINSLPEASMNDGLLNTSPSSSPHYENTLGGSQLGSMGSLMALGQAKRHAPKGILAAVQRASPLHRGSSSMGLADGYSMPNMVANMKAQMQGPWRSPFLSKLESIASSAVKVADKVCASLMVVYTHTGATAQLVAKYRPPVPILTLVVPNLCSDGLTWKLQGRCFARQCLLTRGVLPVLANPAATGDESMNQAAEYATAMGITRPGDHIVCVQRTHNDFCVKVLAVDQLGFGVRTGRRAFGDAPAFTQLPGANMPGNMSMRRIPFAPSPSLSLPSTAVSLAAPLVGLLATLQSVPEV